MSWYSYIICDYATCDLYDLVFCMINHISTDSTPCVLCSRGTCYVSAICCVVSVLIQKEAIMGISSLNVHHPDTALLNGFTSRMFTILIQAQPLTAPQQVSIPSPTITAKELWSWAVSLLPHSFTGPSCLPSFRSYTWRGSWSGLFWSSNQSVYIFVFYFVIA